MLEEDLEAENPKEERVNDTLKNIIVNYQKDKKISDVQLKEELKRIMKK